MKLHGAAIVLAVMFSFQANAAPSAKGAAIHAALDACFKDMMAMKPCDPSKFQSMVNGASAADINSKDKMGQTVLHRVSGAAVTPQWVELGKLLIKKGASINAKDSIGTTPLGQAVMIGSPPMVQALLAAGANPKIKNENHEDAYALSKYRVEQDARAVASAEASKNPNILNAAKIQQDRDAEVGRILKK